MADYVPKMPVPQGPTVGRDTSAGLVQTRDGHTGTLTADNLVGSGHGEPIGVHPMAVPRAEMRARDRKRQEEATQERQRAIAERKSKTAAPEEGAGKRWPSLRGLGRKTVLQPTPSDDVATTAEPQAVTEKVEDAPVAPVAEQQPVALTPALTPTLTPAPALTPAQDTKEAKETPEETPEPPQVDAGAPAFAAPAGAGDDALPSDPADEAAPQKKAEPPVKKTGGGKKRSAQPGTMGAQSAPVKFTPQLDQGSEGAMLRSVTSHQGMDMVMALQAGGKQFGKAQIREHYNAKNAVPGIQQPTGMPAGPFQPGNWPLEGTPLAKKPAMRPGSGVLARPFPTEHPLLETRSFWQRFMTHARGVTPASPANREQAETVGQLQGLVHSSETPQVETSFGPQPHVPLVGDSDPNVARTNADAAHGQTVAELQRRQLDTQVDVGDSLVRPTVAVDTLHHQTEFSAGDTYDYGNPALHEILPEHKSILDADAEGMLREEADKTAAESQRVEADYELERTRHIEEGHAQIAEEEAATQERQLNARTTNSDDIASLREDWRGENEVVLDEFGEQCDSEQAEMEAELDEIQLNADGEVTAEITAAEQEAAEAKRKAEERVARRREEAKKKEAEKSWFDMAVDAVKSFFAELTAFVSQVFDDLRSWVKQKFEQAKKWVVAKIEQARQAIVGAIKWFGEKLKGFVDIAFAAFPKIRDKFKAKIDQAMDATIDFVNEQAERLKAFAQKVLDAMAQMVDAALQVMETLIIAQLKALEFLAVAAIRMAEYFYNMLLDAILKIGTLVAFVGLIASGFLLGFMWEFLGEDTREYLIDLLFDVGIWVFENAPDDFGFGVIWPLFVHGMLGFLYEAQETPMEDKKKIMQKVSDIVTLKDTEFLWAFVKNIFVGIWDNIVGIFEGIWMLVRFIFYDMWVLMGDFIDWIKKVAPDIAEMVVTLIKDVKDFAADFKKEGPDKMESILSSKNIQKVMDFLNGLGDTLRVQAEVMGARAASGFREFMLSPLAGKVIGEKLGWLYGNIIVEVVLAVFTLGIGTAIKGGLKAVEWLGKFANWFRKFGKVGRGLARVAEFFGKGLRWLTKTIEKFAAKMMELGDKLLAKFKQIFKNIEKKIDDIVAKMSGKADDVPTQTDELVEHADDVPGGKVKMDEDGVVDTDGIDPHDPKNKRRGTRDEDYLLAVAEAKLLIEGQEALGTPAKIAAKVVLGILKSTYPWVSGMEARFDGPGNYDFYLSASPPKKVKDNFKEKPFGRNKNPGKQFTPFEDVPVEGPVKGWWPKLKTLASDYETKGLHVHVDEFEVSILPDHKGGWTVTNTFSSQQKNIGPALKTVENAMQDRGFLTRLYNRIGKARDYLRSSGTELGTQKAGEMNFLLSAIKRSLGQ